jgi:localization factor PodJL
MPLGDWLNSVILNQAAEAGIDPDALGDDESESYGGNDLSTVHERLDDISRRIDKVARSGPAAYAPRRNRETDQLAELVSKLDRRLDQFANATRPMPAAPQLQPAMPVAMPPAAPAVQLPPALDLAVAEIAARQRTLNGEPPISRQPVAMPSVAAAPRAPVPTQDLSGLEEQLRAITTQIETLRKPGVEEAINALRDELSDIAQTITDAMPRRAIDTIEKQIAGLTQRIAEGRQAGVDGNALAGVEHGLAEVRDALQHLTPAESLVGFNDAVAGLAHKIDAIVAQQDPATMQHLEYAVNTLRDISTHVASNETVSQLAAEVQRLSQSVEHIAMASGGSDALANLEHRIAALSDALAERSQSGGSVPPRLEALVGSLAEKIEQVQMSRGDNVATAHLEDRIAQLVQKLDASDSRLGHLEAIERGLADLLVHIEDIKGAKSGAPGTTSPVVDTLKHEIARTQDSLEAVHGTLGQVVDRLAMIEQGMGGARPMHAMDEPLDLKEPVGKLAVRLIDAAAAAPVAQPQVMAPPIQAPMPPAPPPAAPPPAMEMPDLPEPVAPPKRMPAAHQLPIDPDLPPDQPLEPGSGPPKLRANTAARIAASEAALGGARPVAATVPSNKSNFIAAARRAAQAAVEQKPTGRGPRTAADFMLEDEQPAAPPMRERLMKRVKSLFVASSVIAIVIGGVQIASRFIDFGSLSDKVAQAPVVNDKKLAEIARADNLDAPATVATNSAPETTQTADAGVSPPLTPAAPVTTTAPARAVVPAATSPAANLPTLGMVPPGNAPANPQLWSPADTQLPGFVTGSISRPATTIPKSPSSAPAALNGALPIEIGSVRLRSAATAGDAAAAYEIGVRYAEGHGVTADINEAARWFERAAAKGLAPAQFRYGSLLEKGQGVKKDIAQARRLYLMAANAGNAKAMHNLAVLYAEGIDGKPDYPAAAQWFRKAAERGIPDSQFNLGVLYARGLGVTPDLAESYKWFALAASKGDKEAVKKRDEVGMRLDANALNTVQLAVKNFAAELQPDTAVNVPVPAGGWDAATTPQAPRVKPQVAGPLQLGKR